MKFIQSIAVVVAFLMGMACASAQGYAWPKAKQTYQYLATPGQQEFQSQEFVIGIGPSYCLPANVNIGESGGGKGVWGIDGQADYYPSRYAGLGIDSGLTNTRVQNDLVVDHLDLQLDLRLPLDVVLGPYGKYFALKFSPGIGKDFTDGAYETVLKAGAVVRLSQHVGIEADYRRTFEPMGVGTTHNDSNEKNGIYTYVTLSF